jgi:hypothetical protein
VGYCFFHNDPLLITQGLASGPLVYAENQFMQIAPCVAGCADDPICMSSCLGELGLSSAFSLGLTLDNPTGEHVEYTLHAGFTFSPGSSGVQPMLVLQTLTWTVDPGHSR